MTFVQYSAPKMGRNGLHYESSVGGQEFGPLFAVPLTAAIPFIVAEEARLGEVGNALANVVGCAGTYALQLFAQLVPLQ